MKETRLGCSLCFLITVCECTSIQPFKIDMFFVPGKVWRTVKFVCLAAIERLPKKVYVIFL